MEFYAIADIATSHQQIQRDLQIGALPRFCASIDTVLRDAGDEGEIYCLWGTLQVRRECIRAGVRFTLPGCPNAIAWTITTGYPPAPDRVVIHCTMNRTEHEEDFIESIGVFVADWKQGLEAVFGAGVDRRSVSTDRSV